MQRLEVSCAARRFFKSLGFKGLMRDTELFRVTFIKKYKNKVTAI